MSKTPEQHAAWRDSYLYGRRDGSEAAPRSPRGGDAEAYELGYRWGVRHPVPDMALVEQLDRLSPDSRSYMLRYLGLAG